MMQQPSFKREQHWVSESELFSEKHIIKLVNLVDQEIGSLTPGELANKPAVITISGETLEKHSEDNSQAAAEIPVQHNIP